MKFLEAEIGDRRIRVSRLGLGCGRLFGGIEARHSAKLLERAYELGIRHFDTAPSYGHGQSEDVIGQVFAGVSDISVMTKVGIGRPQGRPSLSALAKRLFIRRMLSHAPQLKKRIVARTASIEPSTQATHARRLDHDKVLRSLDDSLRRLRRDRVDFLCLHEPDRHVIDQPLLALFDSIKAGGAIAGHGLAYGRSVDLAPLGWDVVQSNYDPATLQDHRFRFYHGVLRSAVTAGPGALVAALCTKPNAVFLVSASETHQLDNLVGQVRAAMAEKSPF